MTEVNSQLKLAANPHVSLIFDISIVVIAVAFISYLIYARINHRQIMAKYTPGSSDYDLYNKLYSPQFLVIVILGTLIFLSNIGFRHTGKSKPYILLGFLLFTTTGFIVNLFLMYAFFSGDKKGKKHFNKHDWTGRDEY
jgi:hypothetical protein